MLQMFFSFSVLFRLLVLACLEVCYFKYSFINAYLSVPRLKKGASPENLHKNPIVLLKLAFFLTICVYGANSSVLRSKHIKGSKERYLLGQNTTCEFSGYSPLWSYKTTLKLQLSVEKRWKRRQRAKPHICFVLSSIRIKYPENYP